MPLKREQEIRRDLISGCLPALVFISSDSEKLINRFTDEARERYYQFQIASYTRPAVFLSVGYEAENAQSFESWDDAIEYLKEEND